MIEASFPRSQAVRHSTACCVFLVLSLSALPALAQVVQAEPTAPAPAAPPGPSVPPGSATAQPIGATEIPAAPPATDHVSPAAESAAQRQPPAASAPAQALPTATLAAEGPAQPLAEAPSDAKPEPPKTEHWYEKIKIRGYTQFRYNRLPSFQENDALINPQGDRTIGGENGFSIRRARVIIFGDVHERVSIYLQPDFASAINDQLNVAIMRDWYADVFLTKGKELRLRVGQSKVPYGFENLQSSQNRLPLDRNDAINSAVKDERDIGIFAYWAPAEIRARFKHLVDSGLKGSGDYGVVGLGVYNGQTANRPALSDDMHVVGRVSYPFKFGEQFVEVGAGGYYGKYKIAVDEDEGFELERTKIRDARAIASLMIYPQPFGIAAEANYGVGPSQGEFGTDAESEIKARKLYGGYAQVMYKIDQPFGTEALIPYARATYYDGGKKFETNAPHYEIKELELGIEWQIFKALECVVAYDMADRTSTKTKQQEKGHVTRVQVQVNY